MVFWAGQAPAEVGTYIDVMGRWKACGFRGFSGLMLKAGCSDHGAQTGILDCLPLITQRGLRPQPHQGEENLTTDTTDGHG